VPGKEEPARRRADAVANRDAVVRAAGALYAERGGVDVTFEEIAESAGVGRATVYRHFPTREQLHAALVERIARDIEAAAAELPATPAGFMRLFKAALRVQTDNIAIVDVLRPRALPRENRDELRARVIEVFREPLARAQQAGIVRAELTPQDVRVQLLMLSAVIRPDTAKADQERAWRLAQIAFGASQGAADQA
jgi:AcrR family transcriptional regulator